MTSQLMKVRELIDNIVRTDAKSYDKVDYDELIAKTDWFLARLCDPNCSDEGVAARAIKTLKWRKTYSIRSLDASCFPKEFFQAGIFFTFGTDLAERPIFWFRLRGYQKFGTLSDLMKQFFVYQLESLDQSAKDKGWCFVVDCSKLGLANADMDLNWFIFQTMKCHYLAGAKSVLVYEIPWITRALWGIAKSWLPDGVSKLVNVGSGDDIFKFIGPESVPRDLGGTANYQAVPEVAIPKDVLPLKQLSHLNLTEKERDKFYKAYKF